MHSPEQEIGKNRVINIAGRRAYLTQDPSFYGSSIFDDSCKTYELALPNSRSLFLSFGIDNATGESQFSIERGNGVHTVFKCTEPEVTPYDVFTSKVFSMSDFRRIMQRLIGPLDYIATLEHFEAGRSISLADEKMERGEKVTRPEIDTWVVVRETPGLGRIAFLDLDMFSVRPR